MNTAQVAGVLPHRYPMLLVDRVTELVPGRSIRTLKAVTVNEPWYAAAPAGAAYPQALIVESWGQSAGLLALDGQAAPEGQVMLFGSVADAEFHHPVLPGDLLEHRVRVQRALTDSVVFEGSSHRGDDTVMTVSRMVMAFRPPGALRPATTPVPLTGTTREEARR
ncbi:3-hydroxyacyl-[acyl-carrier-protein] dehydratase FabZ [Streptomyces sp. NBRC 14336]|uniref:3-hydroxyacyl-ACP dehydratase FabZ family protein n=1 Tax=Streptomyces sp. NBRC 14336 TaxID=3030992 RepID=UPI00249FD518|nr:hotdog domain-containing protein [Streptomyces sp. NBRC 14336]WBO80866.1 beta-hydroxyacyl-ACP dehydratase [Streptomyces sp. SBE_14.2]GLW48124.1 3-hydroxyacyl-[acyl-carrier-protein] dehydratase FabZ [Streptomyces sp. NBRC 14336]